MMMSRQSMSPGGYLANAVGGGRPMMSGGMRPPMPQMPPMGGMRPPGIMPMPQMPPMGPGAGQPPPQPSMQAPPPQMAPLGGGMPSGTQGGGMMGGMMSGAMSGMRPPGGGIMPPQSGGLFNMGGRF